MILALVLFGSSCATVLGEKPNVKTMDATLTNQQVEDKFQAFKECFLRLPVGKSITEMIRYVDAMTKFETFSIVRENRMQRFIEEKGEATEFLKEGPVHQ